MFLKVCFSAGVMTQIMARLAQRHKVIVFIFPWLAAIYVFLVMDLQAGTAISADKTRPIVALHYL